MAACGRLQPYKISEFMPPEWLLLVRADVRRFRGNIRRIILRGEVGIHRHPERLDDQYPLLGRQAALQDQATVRVEEPAQVPAVVWALAVRGGRATGCTGGRLAWRSPVCLDLN